MDKFSRPFPYEGSKFKLLDTLYALFPPDVDTVVDLFGGSGIVGVNSECKNLVYNDINRNVYNVFRLFHVHDGDWITEQTLSIIARFRPDISQEGYYGLRTHYNSIDRESDEASLCLLALMHFSFSNKIEFSRDNKMNMSWGSAERGGFSDALHGTRIRLFAERLKSKRHIILNCDWHGCLLRVIAPDYAIKTGIPLEPAKTLIYADPPYALTDSTYGRNGMAWDMEKEKMFCDGLMNLADKGFRFMLSNALTHKGKTNEPLRELCEKEGIYVNKAMARKGNSRSVKEREDVIVTNYQPPKAEAIL